MMVRARSDKAMSANVVVKGSSDDLEEVARYLRSQDIEVYSMTVYNITKGLVVIETTVGTFERVFDCTVEEESLVQDLQGIRVPTTVLRAPNITIPTELPMVDSVVLPEPAELSVSA